MRKYRMGEDRKFKIQGATCGLVGDGLLVGAVGAQAVGLDWWAGAGMLLGVGLGLYSLVCWVAIRFSPPPTEPA